MKKKAVIIILFILLVLTLDQMLKIWVKTHMYLGEEIDLIGSWFRLHFIENEGMAFGMVFFEGYWGKLILSSFRIFASVFIGWVVYKMIRKNVSWGLLFTAALVLTGAVGNIIDCIFYGKIFSASYFYSSVASLCPEGGGYAPFLQGKVVDMLQIDLFTIHFPENFLFWGGKSFNFFPAIFNIADSSITIGLFVIMVFYHKQLSAFIISFEKKTDVQITNNE